MALALAAAHARAQPSPAAAGDDAITVVYASCPPQAIDERELINAAQVELAPARVEFVAVSALDAARRDFGRIDKDGTPTLWLRVCGSEPAQIGMIKDGMLSGQQTIDLSDSTPAVRSRALALALAEYYRAQQRALATPQHGEPSADGPARPSPAPATVAASPPATPPRDAGPARDVGAARDAATSLGWFAAVSFRDFTADGTWLLGPEAGVAIGPLRIGLSVLGHRNSDPLGAVTLGSATVLLAYQPLVIGRSPAFVPRVRAELGATYGVGQASGGVRGSDAVALQTSLLLEAPLRVSFGDTLHVELVPACGFAGGLRAHADRRDLATTRGPFFGLSLLLGR